MTRVRIIVEGQTEEAFVTGILADHFLPQGIDLVPILLGKTGGHPTYARVRKDILLHLRAETSAYCTTFLDFYGLGDGFPGTPVPPGLSTSEKAAHIESAISADISQLISSYRPDRRFVPYIQMHEFEGLLFSDPASLARGIHRPDLKDQFQQIRSLFETPEDINDAKDSAPSKRLLALHPSYNKVLHGTQAAQSTGLNKILAACPHFRDWVGRLKSLR